MPEQSSSPDIATWPYFEYVKAGSELIDFHLFIFKGINATDSIYIETLRDTWGKVQEGLLPRNAADEILEQPTSYSEFQLYSNCLVQMVLCRYVDSFISYLTELLALTFKTRPEMLKSRQNFTAEFIVEHLASDDLIQAMVEQRVMELSYKGLAELCEYTDEKLGFPLFLTEDHGKRAIRAVDLRNVIVHNRGIVNRHLIQRQPEFMGQVGMNLKLNGEMAHDLGRFLGDAATDIDARAIAKFGIPHIGPDSVDWSCIRRLQSDQAWIKKSQKR